MGVGGFLKRSLCSLFKKVFCSSSYRYKNDRPVLGIFKVNSNGKRMRTLPCISEACNGASTNLVKNICVHNMCVSKTNVVLGCVHRPVLPA